VGKWGQLRNWLRVYDLNETAYMNTDDVPCTHKTEVAVLLGPSRKNMTDSVAQNANPPATSGEHEAGESYMKNIKEMPQNFLHE
jgi:hypothetical protein